MPKGIINRVDGVNIFNIVNFVNSVNIVNFAKKNVKIVVSFFVKIVVKKCKNAPRASVVYIFDIFVF